jgi:hypothetical protein
MRRGLCNFLDVVMMKSKGNHLRGVEKEFEDEVCECRRCRSGRTRVEPSLKRVANRYLATA